MTVNKIKDQQLQWVNCAYKDYASAAHFASKSDLRSESLFMVIAFKCSVCIFMDLSGEWETAVFLSCF